MTYSNRRRLVFLLRELVFNLHAIIPFTAGIVLTLLISSTQLIDIFQTMDKSGLGLCKTEKTEQGHASPRL